MNTPRRTDSMSDIPSRNISRCSSRTRRVSSLTMPQSPRLSRSSSRLSLLSSSSTISQDSPVHSSHIHVSIRPKYEDIPTSWIIDSNRGIVEHSELGTFQYDHVFDVNDNNDDVYQIVAFPILEKCLQGYNGTIFAYGMTGSGKTYSMRGLLERSIDVLFENVNVVECSILEIYNEKIRDLLVSDNTDLKIVDDKKYGVKVKGLSEIRVESVNQLLELIDRGESLRSMDSTDYNHASSRSHFIVKIKVFIVNNNGNRLSSVLNFCDLAGSERATTHIDRRKEGAYINKSLLALGTVITKLSENTTNMSHIPYRDSKLTRFLQPSLNGQSAISILCTMQLGINFIGETTNTLRFGLRAKNIQLNIKKNTSDCDVNKLIQENEILKNEILELQNTTILTPPPAGGDELYYELVAENSILNEQVEHLKRLQMEKSLLVSQSNVDGIDELSYIVCEEIGDRVTRNRCNEIIAKIKDNVKQYDLRVNEMESYISHLENRLRISEGEVERNKRSSSHQVSNTILPNDDIIDELRDEISELQSSMKRKDAIIRALQGIRDI